MDDYAARNNVRYLHLAIKTAELSRDKRNRHGAVIIRGSNAISTGYNKIKNNTFCEHNGYYSTHAEIDALSKLRFDEDNDKINILVIRLNRSGKLMYSRPCEKCMGILRNCFNVRKIFYSINDGMIMTEVV